MTSIIIVLSVVAVLILAIIIKGLKIVQQSTVMIVERLGKYQQTWEAGLHIKVPFIDRVVKKVSLKVLKGEYADAAIKILDTVGGGLDSAEGIGGSIGNFLGNLIK